MNREKFLVIINTIEGYKTVLKAKHWAEQNSHLHVVFGDLLSDLDEFQDEFAEEGSIIFGKISTTDIKAVSISTHTDVFTDLTKLFKGMHGILENKVEYAGLISLVDNFIHAINKYIYLSNMV